MPLQTRVCMYTHTHTHTHTHKLHIPLEIRAIITQLAELNEYKLKKIDTCDSVPCIAVHPHCCMCECAHARVRVYICGCVRERECERERERESEKERKCVRFQCGGRSGFFYEQTVTSKEHRNTVTVSDGYPQGFGWPVWGVIHTAFFFNTYDNKTTICT